MDCRNVLLVEMSMKVSTKISAKYFVYATSATYKVFLFWFYLILDVELKRERIPTFDSSLIPGQQTDARTIWNKFWMCPVIYESFWSKSPTMKLGAGSLSK